MPSTKKPLAPITCNITSLCMILHYFGITDDSPDDMLYKIFDSEEYKNDGRFSQWRTSDYPAEEFLYCEPFDLFQEEFEFLYE